MQTITKRVFWGRLFWESPDFRLETPDGDFLLVFFDDELRAFVIENNLEDDRRVSILGEEGRAPRGELVAVLRPSSIVTHHKIAKHAYEIYASGEGGSAFDNWLTAERRLLESVPC